MGGSRGPIATHGRIAALSHPPQGERGRQCGRLPNPDVAPRLSGKRAGSTTACEFAHRAVEYAFGHQRRLAGCALLVDLDADAMGVSVLRLGADCEFGEVAGEAEIAACGEFLRARGQPRCAAGEFCEFGRER